MSPYRRAVSQTVLGIVVMATSVASCISLPGEVSKTGYFPLPELSPAAIPRKGNSNTIGDSESNFYAGAYMPILGEVVDADSKLGVGRKGRSFFYLGDPPEYFVVNPSPTPLNGGTPKGYYSPDGPSLSKSFGVTLSTGETGIPLGSLGFLNFDLSAGQQFQLQKLRTVKLNLLDFDYVNGLADTVASGNLYFVDSVLVSDIVDITSLGSAVQYRETNGQLSPLNPQIKAKLDRDYQGIGIIVGIKLQRLDDLASITAQGEQAVGSHSFGEGYRRLFNSSYDPSGAPFTIQRSANRVKLMFNAPLLSAIHRLFATGLKNGPMSTNVIDLEEGTHELHFTALGGNKLYAVRVVVEIDNLMNVTEKKDARIVRYMSWHAVSRDEIVHIAEKIKSAKLDFHLIHHLITALAGDLVRRDSPATFPEAAAHPDSSVPQELSKLKNVIAKYSDEDGLDDEQRLLLRESQGMIAFYEHGNVRIPLNDSLVEAITARLKADTAHLFKVSLVRAEDARRRGDCATALNEYGRIVDVLPSLQVPEDIRHKQAVCHYQRGLALAKATQTEDEAAAEFLKASEIIGKYPIRRDATLTFRWNGRQDEEKVPFPWSITRKVFTGIETVEVRDRFGETILCLSSDHSSVRLNLPVNIDVEATPKLSWQWMVTAVPAEGDMTLREKDDQAIQVLVGFADVEEQAPEFELTLTSLIRRNPNPKIFHFFWDSNNPKGTYNFQSEKYPLIYLEYPRFAVSSGKSAESLNKWEAIEVDLEEKYREVYRDKKYYNKDGKLPRVGLIGVQSNTQYTGSYAKGCITKLTFSKKEAMPTAMPVRQ